MGGRSFVSVTQLNNLSQKFLEKRSIAGVADNAKELAKAILDAHVE